MVYIYNTNGDIIQRSKNLSGIRRFASNVQIESIELSGTSDGGGILNVQFFGASAAPYFASFEVMQRFVRNWRNAHGVPLTVNGILRGTVSSKKPIGYPNVAVKKNEQR